MPEPKHQSPVFFRELSDFAKEKHETLWLATRFQPKMERIRSLCFLALDAEFYRIVSTTQEAAIALIRLQWWRDELVKLEAGSEPQQTLAALAVDWLVRDDKSNVGGVMRLIDVYDDQCSGAPSNYASVLFSVLFRVEGEPQKSTDIFSQHFAAVFSGSNAGSLARADVLAVAEDLKDLPEAIWPWFSLLEFLEDWRQKKPPARLSRRWRAFVSFLSGEARLERRLRKIADAL